MRVDVLARLPLSLFFIICYYLVNINISPPSRLAHSINRLGYCSARYEEVVRQSSHLYREDGGLIRGGGAVARSEGTLLGTPPQSEGLRLPRASRADLPQRRYPRMACACYMATWCLLGRLGKFAPKIFYRKNKPST